MFERVMVANRGEIAVRILATLRRLGIASVAVYSDADRDALHVRRADDAVRLGPTAPAESYLHVERVVDAARRVGADALHPGYGFLAESAELARACADAGITFVGPSPEAIAAMGDKIRARDTVEAAGVPTVPGRSGAGLTDDELAGAAVDVGLPVLLKPAAGGGGKGMRRVDDPGQLADAIAGSRRESLAAFGDDTLLVERFVDRPRHIEVQVLADHHGNVVHLGERECSLQRRHQKIIEEAPSPLLTPTQRAAMGTQAIAVARACGYTNAGTVEFIVSGHAPDDFFFIEMNTRLQVEHPVTEAIHGLDLVEAQLRVAAGEPLTFTQADVEARGHAVEARIYAEDPDAGFVPTGGTVLALRQPSGPGIRVDSALAVGAAVGSTYDPMLAKVIAVGDDRATALRRLDRALADTSILGVTTNVAFLRRLLADDAVRGGDLDTGLVERLEPVAGDTPVEVAVAALFTLIDPTETTNGWGRRDGWRLGEAAWITADVAVGDQPTRVRVRRTLDGWTAVVDDGDPVEVAAVAATATEIAFDHDGRRHRFDRSATVDGVAWLGRDGHAWPVSVGADDRTATDTTAGTGEITSPMPGTVVAVAVTVGDRVGAGDTVAVVEAMKMEHTLVTPIDGTVTAVEVTPGAQVTRRQVVVTVSPDGGPQPQDHP